MKVQTKLILGFVIIYLLFGSAIFVSVYKSSKELEKSVTLDLQILIQEITGHMDIYVNERIGDFTAYSKDSILQEFVLQSNAEFEKLSNIQGYIDQKDKEWVSAQKSEITPFMQQLIGNKLADELRGNIKFYEANYGYRLYGEVFVTNKYGANVAQTGKTSDYRQDDENWWQKTRENGIYVEEPEYDESADVYLTAIGIRVDDENGNFIGVIKVVLNIEGAMGVIEEAEAEKKYSSAEFTLVDANGKIIFSTREYKIFEPYSLFSEIKHGPGYFKSKDALGAERLFIHTHQKGYKNFKGLGWILVVDIERDEVLKPIHDLILTILIFGIVLIVLAGIIGFYIYSTISTSLRKFENTINEIAKGNLEARVDIKSNDEFYALAKAFNSMADQLKDLKRIGKKQKMEKELDALEASYKTGFISEETYKKERARLEESVIRINAIDAKLLQEKGFINKSE